MANDNDNGFGGDGNNVDNGNTVDNGEGFDSFDVGANSLSNGPMGAMGDNFAVNGGSYTDDGSNVAIGNLDLSPAAPAPAPVAVAQSPATVSLSQIGQALQSLAGPTALGISAGFAYANGNPIQGTGLATASVAGLANNVGALGTLAGAMGQAEIDSMTGGIGFSINSTASESVGMDVGGGGGAIDPSVYAMAVPTWFFTSDSGQGG